MFRMISYCTITFFVTCSIITEKMIYIQEGGKGNYECRGQLYNLLCLSQVARLQHFIIKVLSLSSG